MENKEVEKVNLSIPKEEFEAVLNLCKKTFARVEDYTSQRKKFLETHDKKLKKAEEMFRPNMPESEYLKKIKAIKRIADVIDKKGTRKLREMLGSNRDIYNMLEFLKKFSEVGAYDHIDLTFLNKKD